MSSHLVQLWTIQRAYVVFIYEVNLSGRPDTERRHPKVIPKRLWFRIILSEYGREYSEWAASLWTNPNVTSHGGTRRLDDVITELCKTQNHIYTFLLQM